MNAPKIEQVGEWVIGWRDGMIGDTGWSMWWGHAPCLLDVDLPCSTPPQTLTMMRTMPA